MRIARMSACRENQVNQVQAKVPLVTLEMKYVPCQFFTMYLGVMCSLIFLVFVCLLGAKRRAWTKSRH